MTDISRLEEVLHHLNTCVMEKVQQMKVCCDSCQSLLRPWPPKIREKQKEINSEDNKSEERPRQGAVPEVTPEELQAVSLVDKLLTKAQKARNTQRKVNTTGKHNQSEAAQEAKTRGEIITADKTLLSQESETQLLQSPSSQSSDGRAKIEPQAEAPASSVVAVDHKKKLPPIPRLSSGPGSRLHTETQRKASSQPCSQPCSSRPQGQRPISARTSTSRQSTAPKAGPGSACAQLSSAPLTRLPSDARHLGPKPVHTSAPFKTDPHLRMPSRQKNLPPKLTKGRSASQPEVFHGKKKSQVKGGTGASRNQKRREEVGEDLVEFPPVVILGDGTVLDGTELSGSTSMTDEKDSGGLTKNDSQENVLSSSFGDSRTGDHSTSGSCSFKKADERKREAKPSQAVSNCQLQDNATSSAGADQEAEGSSQKPFLLQRDGRTLSIPIKLRRLYASNCQLRGKLHSAVVTKKVDAPDFGKAFAARLEGQMEGEAVLQRQEGFLRCLQEHTGLLQLMHSLQLPALSNDTSTEEVYRAKVLVEYILTRFNELQDEAEQYIKGRPLAAFGDDLPEVECENGSLEQWFHNDFKSRGVSSSATLGYRSSQQLQCWRHLQFQQQLLSFHCSLADLAVGLLPMLHSLGPQSREYAPVFRAIFALLTSQGQHLPALVATNS